MAHNTPAFAGSGSIISTSWLSESPGAPGTAGRALKPGTFTVSAPGSHGRARTWPSTRNSRRRRGAGTWRSSPRHPWSVRWRAHPSSFGWGLMIDRPSALSAQYAVLQAALFPHLQANVRAHSAAACGRPLCVVRASSGMTGRTSGREPPQLPTMMIIGRSSCAPATPWAY
jgi:hypothetical protein